MISVRQFLAGMIALAFFIHPVSALVADSYKREWFNTRIGHKVNGDGYFAELEVDANPRMDAVLMNLKVVAEVDRALQGQDLGGTARCKVKAVRQTIGLTIFEVDCKRLAKD